MNDEDIRTTNDGGGLGKLVEHSLRFGSHGLQSTRYELISVASEAPLSDSEGTRI